MKKYILFFCICITCFAFIISCGPLKYFHKDPAFSYEYPTGYKADPLQAKTEVARFSNTNPYKVPAYVASVSDKQKGVKLEDLPNTAVKNIQSNFPGASNFEILDKKLDKLSDGTDVMTVRLKWRWSDNMTNLETAMVMAFKGDKWITINGTTIVGITTLDEMMKYCMTLNLQP
ncbi:MAG: hypothetical protein MUP22_03695 [Desulfobacterales bacterium]|nr:hypothetical protein [Desulfobacterales bacterium]